MNTRGRFRIPTFGSSKPYPIQTIESVPRGLGPSDKRPHRQPGAAALLWLRGGYLFIHYSAVEQSNRSVGASGVAGIVRNHANGGALVMQFAEESHH